MIGDTYLTLTDFSIYFKGKNPEKNNGKPFKTSCK